MQNLLVVIVVLIALAITIFITVDLIGREEPIPAYKYYDCTSVDQEAFQKSVDECHAESKWNTSEFCVKVYAATRNCIYVQNKFDKVKED